MRTVVAVVLAVLVASGVWAYRWVNLPMALASPSIDLSIEPGTSARQIANDAAAAGVQVEPALLYWWFRLSGESRQIKAGSYEVEVGTSPRGLLNMLVRGEEALRSVTLVEGWSFRQVREALRKADQLKPVIQELPAETSMQQLGMPAVAAEGRFFPDTYTYAKGSSDLSVLQRAARAMDKKLAWAWSQRSAQSPLQSPEQALILASIVEKETGRAAIGP